MQDGLWMKGLVIGIIMLFIGTSIVPSISGDIEIGKNSVLNQNNATSSISSTMTDWWPIFHHDPQHTGFSTSTAPNTNNLIWTYKTGDLIWSSPAVVDGKVFIGSNDKYIYCLNGTTGKKIWSYNTYNEIIFSDPAVVDGKVYLGSTENLYCLNAITGNNIWDKPIRNCRPTVFNNRIFTDFDDSQRTGVYCLDALVGTPIWFFSLGWPDSSSTVAVDNGKVYFGSYYGKVYCLNADTGVKIWDFVTGGSVLFSAPTIADGKVYIGSEDNKIYCLDAMHGNLLWSFTTQNPVQSSPAVANGKVYIGSNDHKVYCLNAVTGAKIWDYTTVDFVATSPAIADGKVYIASDYKVYCLNADTGAKIWDYTTGFIMSSSPAIADGKLYIGSADTKVYCFGDNGNNPPNTPTITGETNGAIQTSYNYTIRTTDPDQGDVKYQIDWGDSTTTNTDFFETGEEIIVSHIWDTKGIYTIKVKAIDEYNAESNWATLTVTMPCSYDKPIPQFLQLLIQRFPNAFPILRHLLG